MAEDSIQYSVDSLNKNGGRIVLYSEKGDICISGSDIVINGILAAPNGNVRINANQVTINGRIYAKGVEMSGTYFNMATSDKDMELLGGGAEEKEIIKIYNRDEDFAEGEASGMEIRDDVLSLSGKTATGQKLIRAYNQEIEDGVSAEVTLDTDRIGVENATVNYQILFDGKSSMEDQLPGEIDAAFSTYNGNMYAFINKSMSWREAETFCEMNGGHLITIHSKGENDVATQLVKKYGCSYTAIGFTDEGDEGNWKWVTGETPGYTNWNPGEPNNSFGRGQDYGYMYSSGKWDDGYNNNRTPFLCEWEHKKRLVPEEGRKIRLVVEIDGSVEAGEGWNCTENEDGTTTALYEADTLGEIRSCPLSLAIRPNRGEGYQSVIRDSYYTYYDVYGEGHRVSMGDLWLPVDRVADQGTWRAVYDSGMEGTKWGSVCWEAANAGDSQIKAHVKAYDSERKEISEADVINGEALERIQGRFIEIQMTLERSRDFRSPSVEWVMVANDKANPYIVKDKVPKSELVCHRLFTQNSWMTAYCKVSGGSGTCSSQTEWSLWKDGEELGEEEWQFRETAPFVISFSVGKPGRYQLQAMTQYGNQQIMSRKEIEVRPLSRIIPIKSLVEAEEINMVIDLPEYARPGETITGQVLFPNGEKIKSIAVYDGEREIGYSGDKNIRIECPDEEKELTLTVKAEMENGRVATRDNKVILDGTPPDIRIIPEKEVYRPGEKGSFHFEIKEDCAVEEVAVHYDGRELYYWHDEKIEISSLEKGSHTLTVTVTDGAGNKGRSEYHFVVSPEEIPIMTPTEIPVITPIPTEKPTTSPSVTRNPENLPIAVIESPEGEAVLTEPADITGSAYDAEEMDYYTLEYRPEGADDYIRFERSAEPVKSGVLGRLDTTVLPNGKYEIRLSVVDKEGNRNRIIRKYVVEGGLKVGLMNLGFTDIVANMGGMKINVNRNYSSANKSRGDFGIGWSLGVQGMTLSEANPLYTGYKLSVTGSLFAPGYSLNETKSHDIIVAYGDGTSDRFALTLTPNRQSLVPIEEVELGYRCVTNPKVKLEIDGDKRAIVQDTELLFGSVSMYEDVAYKLTTEEGTKIYLSKKKGAYKLEDSNGNTITVDENGYHSADGRSIVLERDGQGRVVSATDPTGNTTSYAYDAAGDIISVTDAADRTVTFAYDKKHNLISITDPMGIAAARNEYDDDGRLTAVIDADGNRTEYEHDIDGRTEIVTDRLGSKTVYLYDGRGNILSKTDANGKTTKSTYDSNGNVLTKTDAAGNVTTYAYDPSGNLAAVTDTEGNTLKNTYNSRNQVTSMNALGDAEILIDYDGNGNLTATTDAEGNQTQYAYDGEGNVTGVTDRIGKVMSAKYDKNGNVIESTDSAGNRVTSTYDERGSRLTQTTYVVTENGTQERTTHYVYNAAGELIQTIDPDGNSTAVERDGNGKMSAAVDSKGRRTEYKYDQRGNVTDILYPDGTTEQFEYDAENRNTKTVSRTGLATTYTYDKTGNLRKQTDARGNTVSYTYDSNYNLLTTTNEAGAVTTYAYDKLNRNTAITDAEGNVTRFTYNAFSLQTSVTDPKGNTTRYEYDASGRRTKILYPDGTETQCGYDARGRGIWKKDAAGRKTEYTYDSSDRLVSVKQPGGAVTIYAYDQAGNLTAAEDPNGNVTRYEYDEAGRRTRVILPDGSRSTSSYDRYGKLTGTEDYNHVKTSYEYDGQDRIIREQAGNETTSYRYDAYGRLAAAKTGSSEITYTYNRYGELEQKTYENGEAVRYIRDRYGRTAEIQVLHKDKELAATKYGYDKMNRLTRVIGRNGEATVYTYDANGNRETATFANGVKLTYTYDSCNRLITQKAVDRTGALTAQYTYTLGKNGERTKAKETGAGGETETEYGYDGENRLVKETVRTGSQKTVYEYGYDQAGNRTSKEKDGLRITYTYDSRNRLATEKTGNSEVAYYYDANGNLLKQSGPTDTIYTYDSRNRLTAYRQGEKKESYTYDAEGARRSRTAGADTTYFVSDTSGSLAQILAETDGSGAARAEYTRADSLTAQARGGKISYYLYDGHGDVRALLDENGAVTDQYRYSAYGELTSKTGDTENHYLYTGEYYDGTSGLYYLRARYMDPSAGRFLTMDTYEGNMYEPVTLHKYLYANGNPVMYNDPSGHFSCTTQAVATAIHDTLQTMYNVNLMGLMSGISNVAVNSVLGKQGMELVSSFFEGYQNGLYLTSILYLTVAVQVCALSVPVQAAYASTFMGMSAVNVAMSTVMFVASVMEHNDREILLYGTLTVLSLFEFSAACNMYCEVTVQGSKGSNTLVYDGRKGGRNVDFYATPDGDVVPATAYRYMDSEYAKETMESMSAPGSYFGFERFDSARDVQDAFQIAPKWNDCKVRGEFDTLQVISEMYVPREFGDTGLGLEPFTRCYPQHGKGGCQQFKYDGTIYFKNVDIIKD